ncbi:hypothetical protein PFISCL1PPCAC_12853, partial [Pristionchus fissidentatus]
MSYFSSNCKLFWMLWMTLYNDIIIMVAHSFVYRYAVVSRISLIRSFCQQIMNPNLTSISQALGGSITAMIFSTFHPVSAQYRAGIARLLDPHVDYSTRFVIGFDADT